MALAAGECQGGVIAENLYTDHRQRFARRQAAHRRHAGAGADRAVEAVDVEVDEAANAIQNAGPAIEKSASDIKERAGRVADKVDNVDVNVDLNTADNKPAPKAK